MHPVVILGSFGVPGKRCLLMPYGDAGEEWNRLEQSAHLFILDAPLRYSFV